MAAPCCVCCYELGCEKCATKTERTLMGQSKSKCVNFICSPIVLVLHSFYAYFYTCIVVYLQRLFNHTVCFACTHYGQCKSCYKYSDKKFKPDNVSLGFNGEEKGLEWKRASEIMKRPVLFQKDVRPSDVVQGSIENCWLMSAFACIAEFPSVVDKVFVNREVSLRGKYQVTLYNAYAEKWQLITVDDYFPVKRKTSAKKPAVKEVEEKEGEADVENQKEKKKDEGEVAEEYALEFARAQDNELWVAVLEKAFAKFRGSYNNLKGGQLLFAFQCLTGDHVFRLSRVKEQGEFFGHWERFILAKETKPTDLGDIHAVKTNYSCTEKDLFDVIRGYDRSKALLGASISLKGNPENVETDHSLEELDAETGLVRGHAYSIISAKRVKGREEHELVLLRNPWGKFEWKGDWSDESQRWTDNPEIKEKLNFTPGDDGLFWMSFQDFVRHFDTIDVCDRTVNYSDFHLDVHENPQEVCKHCLGPAQGCVEGYYTFWCKCQGVKQIYCGNKSQDVLKKAKDKGGRDDDFMATHFDM